VTVADLLAVAGLASVLAVVGCGAGALGVPAGGAPACHGRARLGSYPQGWRPRFAAAPPGATA